VEAVDPAGTIFYSSDIVYRKRSVSAAKSGDEPLSIHLYGSEDCEACREVKERVVPRCLEQLQSGEVPFRYFDVDEGTNIDDYLALEARLADRPHSFPVVVVGDRLLSGPQLTADTLCAAIHAYRMNARGSKSQSPPADSLPWPVLAIIGGILAVVVLGGVFYITARRKGDAR
jgi:hypothetical protein